MIRTDQIKPRIRFVSLLILAMSVANCGDTIVNVPDSSRSPTAPTTPTVVTSKIEFRVTGNANSVRIRYSNERDGLVQFTTTLPSFSSFSTTLDNLFLSLEVTPISYSQLIQFPFLSAQIYVNGDLFREATSNEFLLNTITVSGNWRR